MEPEMFEHLVPEDIEDPLIPDATHVTNGYEQVEHEILEEDDGLHEQVDYVYETYDDALWPEEGVEEGEPLGAIEEISQTLDGEHYFYTEDGEQVLVEYDEVETEAVPHNGDRTYRTPSTSSSQCFYVPSNQNRRIATIEECQVCGVVLKHPSKIRAHMRTHTGEKPFVCSICGQSFTQRTPMRTHEKRHLNAYDFECRHCGKRFVSNALRNAHELRHSGVKRRGPPRPYLKPNKRRIFHPEMIARAEHHAEQAMRHQLPPEMVIRSSMIIPATTPEQDAAASKRLDEVIDAVAAGRPVTQPRKLTRRAPPLIAQCQLCGIVLKHPSKIQAHMRSHTGERPFRCPVKDCGMGLSTSGALRVHIRRKHTAGEREYPCTWECGRRFVSISARNEHERIVHAGEKRYSCTAPGCFRMFSRRYYLILHRNKEHPELCAYEQFDQTSPVYLDSLVGDIEEEQVIEEETDGHIMEEAYGEFEQVEEEVISDEFYQEEQDDLADIPILKQELPWKGEEMYAGNSQMDTIPNGIVQGVR